MIWTHASQSSQVKWLVLELASQGRSSTDVEAIRKAERMILPQRHCETSRPKQEVTKSITTTIGSHVRSSDRVLLTCLGLIPMSSTRASTSSSANSARRLSRRPTVDQSRESSRATSISMDGSHQDSFTTRSSRSSTINTFKTLISDLNHRRRASSSPSSTCSTSSHEARLQGRISSQASNG